MQVVETTDRAAVGELLRMNEYVDIIVPRGGKNLVERIMADSRIPMIKHLDGVCHVYIDDRADAAKAVRIADNAKTQRYGTCNTMETLLVHEAIAPKVLPRAGADLPRQGRRAPRRRGDARARAADETGDRGRTGTPSTSRRSSNVRVVKRHRPGDGPHCALRLAAHRRDRDRG